MLPCITLMSAEWNNTFLNSILSKKTKTSSFSIGFALSVWFVCFMQWLFSRFTAAALQEICNSAPSAALHSLCESHNSPRVKWQEIIMANHVLWLYCLCWKTCTWLSVSPLGNAKLSHKAETNSTILITNVTSAGHLSSPSGISIVLEHEKWVSQWFGCWIQNTQLQTASTILAHTGDDVNIWQMFCLHEMIYSHSSHAQVSNIRKK